MIPWQFAWQALNDYVLTLTQSVKSILTWRQRRQHLLFFICAIKRKKGLMWLHFCCICVVFSSFTIFFSCFSCYLVLLLLDVTTHGNMVIHLSRQASVIACGNKFVSKENCHIRHKLVKGDTCPLIFYCGIFFQTWSLAVLRQQMWRQRWRNSRRKYTTTLSLERLLSRYSARRC